MYLLLFKKIKTSNWHKEVYHYPNYCLKYSFLKKMAIVQITFLCWNCIKAWIVNFMTGMNMFISYSKIKNTLIVTKLYRNM